MEANLTLVITAAALIGCGVYLLLERSLSRVLMGLILMSNGVSIAFLVSSGPAGDAPIVGAGDPGDLADPLPQAMVLTAVVIMLATTAFLLAMAYRSWQLNGHDDVQDDTEDALIRRLAAQDVASDSYRMDRSDEDAEDAASDFTEQELADAAEAAERAEAERLEVEQRAQEKVSADLWAQEKAAQERESRRTKTGGTDEEKGSES